MTGRPRTRVPRATMVTLALAVSFYAHAQAAGDDEQKLERDLARLKNCATLDALRAKAGTRPLTPYEKRLKTQLVPWYLAHCLPGPP
jgi:hypothetical protein